MESRRASRPPGTLTEGTGHVRMQQQPTTAPRQGHTSAHGALASHTSAFEILDGTTQTNMRAARHRPTNIAYRRRQPISPRAQTQSAPKSPAQTAHVCRRPSQIRFFRGSVVTIWGFDGLGLERTRSAAAWFESLGALERPGHLLRGPRPLQRPTDTVPVTNSRFTGF